MDEIRLKQIIINIWREKYAPDQPRVPAGNPEGGEWTNAGNTGNWSPSMSKIDAEKWVGNSKLKQTFYHGLGVSESGKILSESEINTKIDSIKNTGFRSDLPVNRAAGERGSGMLGPGIYFSGRKDHADRYGKVIEVKLNVNKPYVADMDNWRKTYGRIVREFKELPPSQRIKAWADKNNYDAIHLTSGLDQIIVWDNHKITVIK